MAAAPQSLPLILASASPRRQSLLAQAGIVPARIVAPEVDETPGRAELPRAYALRMAVAKAEAVWSMVSSDPSPKSSLARLDKISTLPQGEGKFIILAADTVVALGRRILPKADDADEVSRCLNLLSGRRHQVLTAVALAAPDAKIRTRIVMTRVAFKRLTAGEIANYAASGEGTGKAGGYAIQGRAETFVRFINGSYSNVVGLPLLETVALLRGAGYALP